MRKFILLLIFHLFLPSITVAEDAPLKVGIISGLSGAAAKWNRFQNMGIQLAQEELSEAGFPIELLYEDSATQAPRVISAYNKLVNLDKVEAIIANDFGFVVAPLLPIVKREKHLLVALSLPHDRYCQQADGYFYSASSQFSRTKDAFERFFILNPDVEKIALVVFDDPEWGITYKKVWETIAKARDVEIVETFMSAEFTPDFKSVLTKMLLKKPDAIFLAHEPTSFLKAVNQMGYNGFIVSANHIFETLADSEAPNPQVEGVYLVDPKISEDFRLKFQKRFSQYPMLEAYSGYEVLRSVAEAFKNNRKAPNLGMREVAYSGVAGPINYTGTSCAGNQSNWALFQFKDGMPVELQGMGR